MLRSAVRELSSSIQQVRRSFGVKVPVNFQEYRVKELKALLEKFVNLKVQNPDNKKLLLFRSAESLGSQAGMLFGDIDFPLTEKGKTQAHILGMSLQQYRNHITHVYCSTQKRSLQTAKISFNIEPVITKLEDGRTAEEMVRDYLEEFKPHRMLQDQDFDPEYDMYKLPMRTFQGTEGPILLDARFREFSYGWLEGICLRNLRFAEKDITTQL